MSQLKSKHLLGIKELDPSEIELIFDTADRFKDVINRPIKKVPSLRDVTIANVFFENSTRTRLSFELAEKRLSADVVNFSSSGSSTIFAGEPMASFHGGTSFVTTAPAATNAPSPISTDGSMTEFAPTVAPRPITGPFSS